MSSTQEKISVIIPVYNHADYIGEAIRSVLGQTLAPLEILVVDDGSTDNGLEIAEAFGPPVRVFRQNHLGISAARNLAIQNSSGEFFAFLDADDLFEPTKLQKQIQLFEANPDIDMVFGMVRQFFSPEVSPEFQKTKSCPSQPMAGIIPGTLIIRRESFERVGFFDHQVQVAEFADWYARAKDKGLREILLSEVVYHRRIHGNNHGIRETDAKKAYLRVLKASLDRKRLLKAETKNVGKEIE